jgi:hypothetical protein
MKRTVSFPFFCLFLFAIIQLRNQKNFLGLKNIGGGAIDPLAPLKYAYGLDDIKYRTISQLAQRNG